MSKKIGYIQITKPLFVSVMTDIEKQCRREEACSEAFRTLLMREDIDFNTTTQLKSQLIHMLQLAMNDCSHPSWIEYYMFETNFGKDFVKAYGYARQNGQNVDLSNAGALYDFLVMENQLNNKKNEKN